MPPDPPKFQWGMLSYLSTSSQPHHSKTSSYATVEEHTMDSVVQGDHVYTLELALVDPLPFRLLP